MKLGFRQSTYTIYRLITADLANQTKHVAFASSIFKCTLLDPCAKTLLKFVKFGWRTNWELFGTAKPY